MGKLKELMGQSGLEVGIFLLSLAIFAFYLVVFFSSLNSLVSDYSWGDVVYHHQIFYNFLHGRPFQTSVYRNALVFSENPYAYLNTFNIHLYLSPFLFSPIYLLHPDLNGLYFSVIAVFYASLAFFTWKLVCFFTAENRGQKYLLIMSFVLTNAFIFSLTVNKASPIVLSLPFLLAAYYFLQKERYYLFYLFAILFCFSYDDCGLLFISFLPYVYFFERKHLKPAIIAAVFGFLTVAVIVGVLQPMGRARIPGTSTASMLDQFRLTWSLLSADFLYRFALRTTASLSSYGLLFLIFPVAWLWSNRSKSLPPDLYRCLGLIFLAPLSHWASIVINVGVHFMPVAVFTLIAVTFYVSRSPFEFPQSWTWRRGLPWAIIGLFFAANLFVFSYPKRYYFDQEHREEKNANLRCLRQIDRWVPSEASLTYWTARSLDGYLGNRSDLWRFPDYFDQTDFLIMQKEAKETFFLADLSPGQDVYQAVKAGSYHSSGERNVMDRQVVEAIRDRLVMTAGSHTVIYDDPELVILRRKETIRFAQPPETRGAGFFLNFPSYWQSRFPG